MCIWFRSLAILLFAFVSQMTFVTQCFSQTNPRQYFVCNTGYSPQRCRDDLAVLKQALTKYPVEELGDWTWVLVRTQDWKSILLPRGLDPNSPAFTYYEKRETFIEEILVGENSIRRGELLKEWGMTMPALLDFAIAHELGHALCNERDEAKTNRIAHNLQRGNPIDCEIKPPHKRSPNLRAWISR